MGWWLLAAAILCGFVLAAPTLLGVFLPTHFTGWALLRKELKKNGVQPDALPRDCLRELTNQGLRVAETLSEVMEQNEKEMIVQQMESISASVSMYLNFPDSPILKDIGSEDDPIYRILNAHGLIASSLRSSQ